MAKRVPDDLYTPTLGDFLSDIWRFKGWVVTGICFGLALAGLFIISAVPNFKAQAIIAPAVPMGVGAAASNAAGLSNEDIFALRFVFQHINAGQGSDFQRFETIFSGPSVAAILLKDERVMAGLRNDMAFRIGSDQAQTPWTARRMADYLQRRVKLESAGISSARRLVYSHPDPQFAEYLLGAVHHIGDGLIRKSVREEAKARVDYLTGALAQTSNPEHRRALTALLMEQERVLMLVSIDQPYAAAMIEPPSSRLRPDWPDRPLTFLVFAFCGALAGFIAASVRAGRGK